MARKIFEILEDARKEISGDPDMDQLTRWLDWVRSALQGEMPSDRVIFDLVHRYMTARYATITRSVKKRHALPRSFSPDMIAAEYRHYLRDRITASVELIKLNRDEEIERQTRRFAGWATGASLSDKSDDDFNELKKSTRKSIAGMTFIRRRVCTDQGHKLMAAIDDTIALQYGAVAREWRHVIPHSGYQSREEHLERDHRIYAIRGIDGVKAGKDGYVDELPDQPGELPYCSCFYRSIYDVDELPREMRSVAGAR